MRILSPLARLLLTAGLTICAGTAPAHADVLGTITGAAEDVGRAVGGAAGDVVRGAGTVAGDAADAVAQGAEAAGAAASDVGAGIAAGARTAAEATASGASVALEGATGLGEATIGAVEQAVGALPGGAVARATAAHSDRIGGLARDLAANLPDGRTAAALASALAAGDAAEAQRILRDHGPMRPLLDRLRARGFNTVAVGIESSAAAVGGGGHETGVAMDIALTGQPRLYTTTSAALGYYFGGGNDLVFTFLRARPAAIDGHAVGSVAEFDVGSGAGMNMWFVVDPFDFAGFSLGVGIGSVGGGGALTYAYTNSWL